MKISTSPSLRFISSALLIVSLIECSEQADLIADKDTDFCADLQRDDSIFLSKEMAPFANLMETKTGILVLEDGAGSMVTRAWFSEYAEETINIEYFIGVNEVISGTDSFSIG